MTDLRTSSADLDLSLIKDLLGTLQADVAKLTLRHAAQVEGDLSVVKERLGALQSDVRKIDVIVTALSGKFDVAIQFHERLAALETLVDNLPERRRPPGNNGRFRA